MPEPGKNETEQEFIKRCIPIVLEDGTAEDQKQAAAICYSIWRENKKSVETIVYAGGQVKALGDGKLGGYLITFSTADDPDLSFTHDFFTMATDFGTHTTTPIHYHHGLDTKLGQHVLGTGNLKADDIGIWIEAQLAMRDEYERAIYGLAEAGKLGWSSGTAAHLIEREPVGEAHYIKKWPLGLDASLTPIPAEPRNIAIPLKSLTAIPLEIPSKSTAEATGKMAPDQLIVNESVIFHNSSIKENNMSEIDVQAIAQAAAQEAIKQYTAVNPSPAGGVQVVKDEADQKFATAGEFLMAVKTAAQYPGQGDKRLLAFKATGASESIPADGGYLVEPQFAAGIHERMYSAGQVLSRVAVDQIGPNSSGMTYHLVDETSRADGSRWGGVTGYWLGEGATITASKPAFMNLDLRLKKVAALCYATDELLADSVALESWLTRTVPDELRFKVEDAVINGDGVAKPQGIMNADCLISVTRTNASTVIIGDVLGMWARRWAGVNDYVWLIDQSVGPQLYQLLIGSYAPAYMPPGGLSGTPYATLMGRPVIECEYMAALGTAGDILLASLSQYQTIQKGGIEAASSIHVQFTTAEQAFRFIYRIDGQASWASALTPKNAGNTLSPFVRLSTSS